ncbi:acetyl-CoA carboxylase biotin carboxylase subunit [Collimonas pratensis]|uniref:Carbamoyl-phosphate synthase L chain, ATP binding domain protein n=1 Tax=Collimonas pratensis TaxID=279113 RepID=A0A127Q0D5_9BURK|nr:biotin carboxylase N-terminal domain-containing protein [Collimonas pratensis]AMP03493.1 carbamoyl-phosphate synthase L chain, ATP binding domain protein [Collimonas pratensis]
MNKILIANRGEIACRIIQAARGLGIKTIAVYSDADAGSLHCEMADFAVRVGSAPAGQSYLDMDAVLQAGIQHGAEGVHPGYGFLSENTVFAKAAERNGITWIGPTAESIEDMGDKHRARSIAQACGVPVLPGSRAFLPGENPELLTLEAARVGFPLLVKAAGGGGGIGMKRVDDPAALAAAVISTQSQALKAFNDASIYLERFVPRARHIEVQVFGYGDGTAVHLFERECSVQRRFQKIVEESPAPHLAPEVLDRMFSAALSLTAGQRYRGAGTVEFILDAVSQEFYFLEMNTRIQVEHGVTEAITGWDLVRSQILLAAGTLEKMPQTSIRRNGAAVECRVYAENPAKNFLPSPGLLERFVLPSQVDGLRVDTGVRQGDLITSFYDPMIAKLITWAPTRAGALQRMDTALQSTEISGIRHNTVFLQRVIRHPEFQAGKVDTSFVDREKAALLADLAESARIDAGPLKVAS